MITVMMNRETRAMHLSSTRYVCRSDSCVQMTELTALSVQPHVTKIVPDIKNSKHYCALKWNTLFQSEFFTTYNNVFFLSLVVGVGNLYLHFYHGNATFNII